MSGFRKDPPPPPPRTHTHTEREMTMCTHIWGQKLICIWMCAKFPFFMSTDFILSFHCQQYTVKNNTKHARNRKLSLSQTSIMYTLKPNTVHRYIWNKHSYSATSHTSRIGLCDISNGASIISVPDQKSSNVWKSPDEVLLGRVILMVHEHTFFLILRIIQYLP